MADQSKKSSLAENGEHGHSSKKPRAQSMPNGGLVKQEAQEIGGEEEEVSQGRGAGAGGLVVATEAMDEPQISLRLPLTLLHCQACLLPLRPPTFKCEAGHVVCCSCRTSHGLACGGAATYAACAEVDAFVRGAKQPCAYEEFGCRRLVAYHEAAEHHRACQCAPCSCPSPGCDFLSSPARLADHFAAAHSWPVTGVTYGKPHRLAVPPPPYDGCHWHVLVGGDDGSVFLVSPCALGAAAVAVSLVCVRASGDAAGGASQYRCKLWAEVPGNKVNMAMMLSMVGSSNLSGGFSAADQGMFLALPPELLHDVSGEAPVLMVRIDRTGSAPAAAISATPPATRNSIKAAVIGNSRPRLGSQRSRCSASDIFQI